MKEEGKLITLGCGKKTTAVIMSNASVSLLQTLQHACMKHALPIDHHKIIVSACSISPARGDEIHQVDLSCLSVLNVQEHEDADLNLAADFHASV